MTGLVVLITLIIVAYVGREVLAGIRDVIETITAEEGEQI